jgi:hypothetical protein
MAPQPARGEAQDEQLFAAPASGLFECSHRNLRMPQNHKVNSIAVKMNHTGGWMGGGMWIWTVIGVLVSCWSS